MVIKVITIQFSMCCNYFANLPKKIIVMPNTKDMPEDIKTITGQFTCYL